MIFFLRPFGVFVEGFSVTVWNSLINEYSVKSQPNQIIDKLKLPSSANFCFSSSIFSLIDIF